jgi:type II pantothenate kinase
VSHILHCVSSGGAYKFGEQFQKELGVQLHKRDEITCLVAGLSFCLKHVPHECWYLQDPYSPLTSSKIEYDMRGDIFPYLLVNIGTGVSILRVDSPSSYERVAGSCVAGGTFWGLCRLLTGVTTFDEAMKLCLSGDRNKVDMLVG